MAQVDQADCFQLEWLWHAIFLREQAFTGLTLMGLLAVLRERDQAWDKAAAAA